MYKQEHFSRVYDLSSVFLLVISSIVLHGYYCLHLGCRSFRVSGVLHIIFETCIKLAILG